MSHPGNDALNELILDIKSDIMADIETAFGATTDGVDGLKVYVKSHQPSQLDIYSASTHKKLGVLNITLEIEGRD